MDLNDVRTKNLRDVVNAMGGVSKVAKSLDYVNPSFISQMIGPTPVRVVTEKTARKFERDLGLAAVALDAVEGGGAASVPSAARVRKSG